MTGWSAWQIVYWYVAMWLAGVISTVIVASAYVTGWSIVDALFLAYFAALPWGRAWLRIRGREGEP